MSWFCRLKFSCCWSFAVWVYENQCAKHYPLNDLLFQTFRFSRLEQHISPLTHLQGSRPKSPGGRSGRTLQWVAACLAPAQSSRTPERSPTSWEQRSWTCNPGCWGTSLENPVTWWLRRWRWSSWNILDLRGTPRGRKTLGFFVCSLRQME